MASLQENTQTIANILSILDSTALYEDDLIIGSLTNYENNTVTGIRRYAFYYMASFIKVRFNNVNVIGEYAFGYCSNLITADFPKATKIRNYAFGGCSKLSQLILRAPTVCQLYDSSAFQSTPIKNSGGYIYVPSTLISEYQSASIWSTFSEKFRALEDYTVDGTITGELDESKI